MAPINAHTRLVAVLGYPLGHTLSPALHNAAFHAQGVNLRYVACPVPPGRLPAAIEGLRALGFAGANVTIPYKEAVVALLDGLTAEAGAVGAVNTIVAQETDGATRLLGDNTDVDGFLRPLRTHLARLAGTEAVVFGSGGAARAVVFALLQAARLRTLTVVARDRGRANALCDSFADLSPTTLLHSRESGAAGPLVRSATLIVNATPLGLAPNPDSTVWEEGDDFHDQQIVYDLVYNPPRTRLLRLAAARGAETIDGIDMFVGQAAAAYRQWTQCEMPLDLARRVVLDQLADG